MSTNLDRLLEVQDRDRKIAQLVRESKDIPARKAEIESRLNAQRESLAAAQDELKKKTATTHQIEVDIESLKEKITKFREQQFQIKSNDDYRTLEKEIGDTQDRIRALEDQELVVMEEADEQRKLIAEREADLKREDSVVQQDITALDKRAESIEGEIHDLQIDREALAKDVESDWLRRYERIMKHVGDFAVVTVENGSCGGCHMNLPPQVVNDAKKTLSLTLCDFCGRILYWQP